MIYLRNVNPVSQRINRKSVELNFGVDGVASFTNAATTGDIHDTIEAPIIDDE